MAQFKVLLFALGLAGAAIGCALANSFAAASASASASAGGVGVGQPNGYPPMVAPQAGPYAPAYYDSGDQRYDPNRPMPRRLSKVPVVGRIFYDDSQRDLHHMYKHEKDHLRGAKQLVKLEKHAAPKKWGRRVQTDELSVALEEELKAEHNMKHYKNLIKNKIPTYATGPKQHRLHHHHHHHHQPQYQPQYQAQYPQQYNPAINY